jgi:hypothetical protein
VNVDRFLRFTAEKEESVSLMSKNLWHKTIISRCGDEGSAYFLANVEVLSHLPEGEASIMG